MDGAKAMLAGLETTGQRSTANHQPVEVRISACLLAGYISFYFRLTAAAAPITCRVK